MYIFKYFFSTTNIRHHFYATRRILCAVNNIEKLQPLISRRLLEKQSINQTLAYSYHMEDLDRWSSVASSLPGVLL